MTSTRRNLARPSRPSRRGAVRVAVTTLTCVGAILGGAATASAVPVDTNRDGRADEDQYDTNRDGRVDVLYKDVNGDGWFDSLTIDTNYDGWADYWTADGNRDGYWDPAVVDTNYDGHADTIAGTTPRVSSPTAASAATCMPPEGGIPVNVPVYGDCAWLQTLAQNSGIGPDPFTVMYP